MNPREYEIMAAVEAEHWWYQSLRQTLQWSLEKYGQNLPTQPSVLDAGCGTGETLRFLQSIYQTRYIGGFDHAPQAIEIAKQKVAAADLYVSDVCQPELRCGSYDIVVSCDVLYIPGLSAAQAGMAAIVQQMSVGGVLLLNLPAYNWLKSDHDLAIHTRQRVVRRQVVDYLNALGLQLCQVTYRLCPLFPLVVASRLPSMLRPRIDAAQAVSSLKPASRLANAIFRQIMHWENRLIQAGINMPFGSSVFAVAKKERSA